MPFPPDPTQDLFGLFNRTYYGDQQDQQDPEKQQSGPDLSSVFDQAYAGFGVDPAVAPPVTPPVPPAPENAEPEGILQSIGAGLHNLAARMREVFSNREVAKAPLLAQQDVTQVAGPQQPYGLNPAYSPAPPPAPELTPDQLAIQEAVGNLNPLLRAKLGAGLTLTSGHVPGMIGSLLQRFAGPQTDESQQFREDVGRGLGKAGTVGKVAAFLGAPAAEVAAVSTGLGALGEAPGLLGRAAQVISKSTPLRLAAEETPFVAGDIAAPEKRPVLLNAALGLAAGGVFEGISSLLKNRSLKPDEIAGLIESGRLDEVTPKQWQKLANQYGDRQDVQDLLSVVAPDMAKNPEDVLRAAKPPEGTQTAIRLPGGRVIAGEGDQIQPHLNLMNRPDIPEGELAQAEAGFMVPDKGFMTREEFGAAYPNLEESNALAGAMGRDVAQSVDEEFGLRGTTSSPEDVAAVDAYRTGNLKPPQAAKLREDLPWVEGASPEDVGLPRAETAAPEVIEERAAARQDLNEVSAPYYDLGKVETPQKTRLQSAIDRFFTAAGDIPEPVFRRILQRDEAFQAHTQRAMELMGDLRSNFRQEFGVFAELGNSPEVRKVSEDIHNVIAGHTDVSVLPERFHQTVREIRKDIDLASTHLINEGIVEGPVAAAVADNLGVYLNRSYRLFKEDDWWGQTLKRIANPQTPEDQALVQAKNKVVNRLREHYKDVPDEELENLFRSLFVRTEGTNPVVRVGSLGMGQDLSILRTRRGYVSSALEQRTKDVLQGDFAESTITEAVQAVRDGNADSAALKQVMRGLRSEVKPSKVLPDFGEGYLISPEEAAAINVQRRQVLQELESRFELSPEVRTLMGEETDIRISYPETMAKMWRMAENHKLMRDLADAGTGTMFFGTKEEAVAGLGGSVNVRRIAGEASEAMAPIAERTGGEVWMDADLATAFEDHYRPRSFGTGMWGAFMKQYMRVNSWVKEGVTVGQVGTHARNTIGGSMFMMFNGHASVFRPIKFAKRFAGAAQAAAAGSGTTEALASTRAGKTVMEWVSGMTRDREASRAYFRELQQLGVVGGDAVTGELRHEMQRRTAHTFTEFTENNFKRAFNRLRKGGQDLYRAEDDIYRVFAFESELARHSDAYAKAGVDISEQELKKIAADKVRQTYQTWEQTPRWVQELSSTVPVVGTFPSFSYQMFRTIVNTSTLAWKELHDPILRGIGMQRAAGAMTTLAMMPAIGKALQTIHGITREDDVNIRENVAPWEKNATLLYLTPLSGGRAKFMNMSYTDPYSVARDPITSMYRILLSGGEPRDMVRDAISAAVTPFESFVGGEILAKAIFQAGTNRNDFGGQIVHTDDPLDFEGYWEPRLQYVWERALSPGFLREGRRIMESFDHADLPGGFERSTANELTALGGFRVRDLNIERSLGFKARDFSQELDDAEYDLRQLVGSRTNPTDEQLTEAWKDYEAKRGRVLDEMHRQSTIAQKTGISERDVMRLWSDGGFSRQDAYSIVNGTYGPRQFTDQWMRSTEERLMRDAETPAERFDIIQEFNRRRGILNQLARGGR